jgi:glutathione S-transferase
MAELATVHLFPPTTCSRRVLMCLAELGCKEGSEFAINLVSTTGPNKTAAHMRLQPFGKIPAWQEGDWVLYDSQHGHTFPWQCLAALGGSVLPRPVAAQPHPYSLGCSSLPLPKAAAGLFIAQESLAICEYLCARFPGAAAAKLLPPPGRARAEVHQWVSVEATELRPHALKPCEPPHRTPPHPTAPHRTPPHPTAPHPIRPSRLACLSADPALSPRARCVRAQTSSGCSSR